MDRETEATSPQRVEQVFPGTRPETAAPVPSPEDLDAVQRSIEEELESGSSEVAASRLAELRPPDRAKVVAGMGEPGRDALLGALPTSALAEIVEHFDLHDAVRVSGLLGTDRLAAVLDETPPDVAADILRSIEWDEASRVLARMRELKSVGAVIIYADDQAGGLMTPEVAALRDDVTAAHAIVVLRSSPYPREAFQQLFVVDDDGVLVGRLNLSDLVFAPASRHLSQIMDPDVVRVETGTDQEDCARLMTRYGIRSLPVVDSTGHLQGAIAIEDLVDVAEAEATEDMFKMFGLGAEDRTTGPIWRSVRSRFPWLLVNLGTVLLAGFLVSLFSSTIEKATILAAFVPVVAGQAGIAGTQTLTLIVRALALGEVTGNDARQLLAREGALAITQGIVLAVLLGAVVWAWQADLYLGLVVAGALLLNLVVAALGGVLVPLGMRAVKIDPATSSAVVVTTLTDSIGIAVYLGLATAFLTTFRAACPLGEC